MKNTTNENTQSARGILRTRLGTVVSAKAAKTITVEIKSKVLHQRYKKYVTRKVKFLAHDEKGQCGVGDLVEVANGRPISKHKSWRVTRVVTKAV